MYLTMPYYTLLYVFLQKRRKLKQDFIPQNFKATKLETESGEDSLGYTQWK